MSKHSSGMSKTPRVTAAEKRQLTSPEGEEPPLQRRRGSLPDLPSLLKEAPPLQEMILKAISSEQFTTKLVPILAPLLSEAIGDLIKPVISMSINAAVKEATEHLQAQITQQQQVIDKQNERIIILQSRCAEIESNSNKTEYHLDNLEQYTRRNSLRFINMPIANPKSTDDAVIKLCRDRLGVELDKSEIDRSHVLNKPRDGRASVIVKFVAYNKRAEVYSQKKKLKGNKDKLFITEDLTKARHSLIQRLILCRTSSKISSFWTQDGRIYACRNQGATPKLIETVDDIARLVSQS